METQQLATQQIQQIESQFNDIVRMAEDAQGEIKTQEQYECALLVMQRSKEIGSKWVAIFEPIRAAQRAALDITFATINKVKTPCETYVKNLTPKVFVWEKKKEAEAKAIEVEFQAAAKKQAEDMAIRQAEAFQIQGRTDVAEAILSTPIPTPPPVITAKADIKTVGQSATLSRKTRWKAQVYDLAALIEAVHKKTPGVPANALEPNMSVLDKLASALGGELNLPGVRAEEVPSYAGRSK